MSKEPERRFRMRNPDGQYIFYKIYEMKNKKIIDEDEFWRILCEFIPEDVSGTDFPDFPPAEQQDPLPFEDLTSIPHEYLFEPVIEEFWCRTCKRLGQKCVVLIQAGW